MTKRQYFHVGKRVMRFLHWTGKGYAVFRSLSAEVTIGRVCKSICEMSLRKLGGIARCRMLPGGLNQQGGFREGDDAQNEWGLLSQHSVQQRFIFHLAMTVAASDDAADHKMTIITHCNRSGWNGLSPSPAAFFVFVCFLHFMGD